MTKLQPIDVLTPLACCVLFGRSAEAVRRAARHGHVRTRFTLMPTAKEVRFIDLESALSYWGGPPRPRSLAVQLAEMRSYGLTVRVAETEYAILHPYPFAIPEPVAESLRWERAATDAS